MSNDQPDASPPDSAPAPAPAAESPPAGSAPPASPGPADPLGGIQPGVVAALLAPPSGGAEKDELAELERFSETLLTTSSILAGFAISGLLGLPSIGDAGLQAGAKALGHTPSPLAYFVVFHAMLLATLAFLGVLISISFVRLRKRYPSARSLRNTLRGTVVIYGVGLASLFAAIVSFAMPNASGFTFALVAGAAVIGALFFRAFVQK